MNNTFKFFYFLLTSLMMFTGCNEEVDLGEQETDTAGITGRTFILDAAMPGDPSPRVSTRVALTQQDNRSIDLTWESGDQLQLVFVQDAIKVAQVVDVRDISADGKLAKFDITIPAELSDGTFDLYGVYGGGGLSESDPTIALLPTNAGDAASLGDVQTREDVMLHFSATDMATADLKAFVTFEHLGSLFNITVKNSSTSALSNLAELRLVADTGGWAFNFGAGGGQFNLISGEFVNAASAGDYISFSTANSILAAGESFTFWGWYPSLPDVNWPELKLELRDGSGNVIQSTTTSSKMEKTSPTPAGKSIRMHATWNGSTLAFGNIGSFTDPRDGRVYKTMTYGDQEWLAENLKYATPPAGNKYNPYYADEVENRGWLYDYDAAMTSCPPGWHLPSRAEWQELVFNLTGDTGASATAGGKLKSTGTVQGGDGLWMDVMDPPDPVKSVNVGATDEIGFSAVPAGSRNDKGGHGGMFYQAWYQTSTITGTGTYHQVLMRNTDTALSFFNYPGFSCSVRCVRD